MLNLLKDDRGGQIFLVLLVFAAIIIPFLNLWNFSNSFSRFYFDSYVGWEISSFCIAGIFSRLGLGVSGNP